MKVLVTGAAGFIGSFTASRFLGRGDEVVGLDNLNDYYDVTLRCFCSLERSLKADQSKCSITDITRVTSPMSRTLWKG